MSSRSTGPNLVDVGEAAELLKLPVPAVEALANSGYLALTDGRFALGDLKAFLARNADNGAGDLFGLATADPEVLLDDLNDRTDDMAERAFEIFAAAFPEALEWDAPARSSFTDQARKRFQAILAVTSHGIELDEALVDDLRLVGAAAAWSDSPLPQLLVVLRISRDLVVQTAVSLAEERGRHWNVALSLLLTRVLPAIDRLTDAIAQGWWATVVKREEEHAARYEHVVEHAVNGVYEADLDGRVQYANPSFSVIVGRAAGEIAGMSLGDLLVSLDGSWSAVELMTNRRDNRRREVEIVRPDGVRRVVDISTVARVRDGEVVGFQGVVQDVTTARDLEHDKNEFLSLVTSEVRQPLTTMLGLGATLEAHGSELPPERLRWMGMAIRRQAERMARLADDLHDISRLDSQSLLLSPRPVDVLDVVMGAMASVTEANGVEIAVPPGIEVLADPRRLEQVIANLVENALEFGSLPVIVSAQDERTHVEISVVDHGQGIPEAMVSQLFSRLRLVTHRVRGRGSPLGLALVRGLVEAMGGRVFYERAEHGGACFRIHVPVPRRV